MKKQHWDEVFEPLLDAAHKIGRNLADHQRKMKEKVSEFLCDLDDVDRPHGDGGSGTGRPDATGGDPRHQWGTRFFGEDQLKYYTGDNATLGREDSAVFLMPTEDAAGLKDGVDVAIATGLAPNVTEAVLRGDRVFGAHIPVGHLEQRLPTAEDAGGWPHFNEGGNTAVIIDGIVLPNATREFVVDGGTPLRDGTIVFELLGGGNIDIIGIVGGAK